MPVALKSWAWVSPAVPTLGAPVTMLSAPN